ncbi:hypothetical protein IFM89_027775 [Coptis chinensis]|uniref:Inositol polyphosphate-related phosphatase domain-containing protein n=1 Tax=Coptis chinensis TaxID=261450 RepID=A0A835I256_9MAGN|nr:hypothetical protein IFM89_027775 [Coptis chinensis]
MKEALQLSVMNFGVMGSTVGVGVGVGVGVMGYIGNKESISVSMSIYQTPFCFICTHLSSGEKDGDELRRNANVQEIHRRTQFRSFSGIGFPKNIHDRDRKVKTSIGKGLTNHNVVERNHDVWCDHILSFGKGLKLVSYKRTETQERGNQSICCSNKYGYLSPSGMLAAFAGGDVVGPTPSWVLFFFFGVSLLVPRIAMYLLVPVIVGGGVVVGCLLVVLSLRCHFLVFGCHFYSWVLMMPVPFFGGGVAFFGVHLIYMLFI